jgi:hypothetical protein
MIGNNIREFPQRHAAVRSGRFCTLHAAGVDVSAALRDVSAAGAFIETDHPLHIDEAVVLSHPLAGAIRARVVRVARDGAALRFLAGEDAATFALASLCAGMTSAADHTLNA